MAHLSLAAALPALELALELEAIRRAMVVVNLDVDVDGVYRFPRRWFHAWA